MKKMLALVCTAVLLLTCITTAIAAEVVSPLANCSHANSSTKIKQSEYKALDTDTHQCVRTSVYMCFDCGTVFWTRVETVTEKHKFTNGLCVCGAEIIIPIDPYPVPGGN